MKKLTTTGAMRCNVIWITFLILVLIVFTLGSSGYFILNSYASHNMISNLVMAAAPLNHLGLPYKNYWDIYPPGIYIFLTPFQYFFHGQTFFFKIFHIMFAIVIGLIVLRILFQIFKDFPYRHIAITVFFFLYIAMSGYFSCILFHNAFLALFVSMIGFYLLFMWKDKWSRYLLSSFFFAFAASMKGTFSFIIFLPFIFITAKYLLREDKNVRLFIKYFILSAIGILIVISINYAYLSALGIQNSYSEVEAFKTHLICYSLFSSMHELFVILNPFNIIFFSVSFYNVLLNYYLQPFILSYAAFLVLFIVFVFYPRIELVKNSYSSWSPTIINKNKIKVSFSNQWNNQQGQGILIFGFLLLNFIGFRIVNKFSPNYILQLTPSILLAVAFLYKQFHKFIVDLARRKTKGDSARNVIIVSIIGSLLFLNFVLPSSSLFGYFRFMPVKKYINGMLLKKPVITIPTKVRLRMGNDDRVFSAYGWGAPDFYYLSKTKPFSRFFIKNILFYNYKMQEAQCKMLIKQFERELPKVIIYTDVQTDMDVNKFERDVINLKKILQKCYKFYPNKTLQFLHYKGYWLLADPGYFKRHMNEFIPNKYLRKSKNNILN